MSEHKQNERAMVLQNQQAYQDIENAEKEHKRCCLRCSLFVSDPRNISGGSCHCNPPAVFPMQGPQGMVFANAWPPVRATTDWCGHFTEQAIKIATTMPGEKR